MSNPESIPQKIFTYAFGGHEGYHRGRYHVFSPNHLYCLFNDRFNATEAKALLELEAFNFLFPALRFGVLLENGYAVTDDINALTPGFNDGVNQRVPAIISGEYQVLYPKKIQDACCIPHRYVLGCPECLDEKDDPELHCRVKALYLEQVKQRLPETIADTIAKWRHLKVQIGEHTFVSPSYTGSKVGFAPRQTSIRRVRFGNIPDNIAFRRDTAKARGQVQLFRKQACVHCLVRAYCPDNHAKWCYGPYDKNENEYYLDILSRSVIPFTNAQIRYLLKNSGELHEKVGGENSYLTFRYRNGLEFVLGEIKTGNEQVLTFRDAKRVIQKYRSPENTERKFPVTKKLKALLVSLATFRESRIRGWGRRREARFITYNFYGELRQYFRYRQGIAGETFQVSSLTDLYREHSRLPLISPSNSPLSLRNRSSYPEIMR